MKKYDEWELSVIKKYFKKGKIPKSSLDIESKLINVDIDSDIRIMLELAVAKIAKKEDISSIAHSILQCEKELDEKKYVNENLRSHISKDLIDDETLSSLELKALREVLKENKESIDFNDGVDVYGQYDEIDDSHHKKK